MAPALLVLVILLALVVGVMILSLVGQNETPETQTDSSEDWLQAARTVVQDGYRLSGRIAVQCDGSPADPPDGVVDDIVSEMEDFNASIAAVSATAPTEMDHRVCREVGVRAQTLCSAYEREVRVREAFGIEHRSTLAGDTLRERARSLEEFEVALNDLEVHVELL